MWLSRKSQLHKANCNRLFTGPSRFDNNSEKAGKMVAGQFLRNFIKVLPYKIHTILTDNGIQLPTARKTKRPDGTSLTASVMKTVLNIA